MSDINDFQTVTELPGEAISAEQLDRLVNRYSWAAQLCRGSDLVEVGCGAGPGLGLLLASARTVEAGDLSLPILERARRHYGDRVALHHCDAQQMPFATGSKDAILLFEAIYYLPNPQVFLRECLRVLRPDGRLLLVTANKDLWDFHPSSHSHAYYGVPELAAMLGAHGFTCEFFGFQLVSAQSMRQRMLRPLKRLAVLTGLMPRTMNGKRWLKRIVFGKPISMPAEVATGMLPYRSPQPIPSDQPDRRHKILYCVATRTGPTRQTIS